MGDRLCRCQPSEPRHPYDLIIGNCPHVERSGRGTRQIWFRGDPNGEGFLIRTMHDSAAESFATCLTARWRRGYPSMGHDAGCGTWWVFRRSRVASSAWQRQQEPILHPRKSREMGCVPWNLPQCGGQRDPYQKNPQPGQSASFVPVAGGRQRARRVAVASGLSVRREPKTHARNLIRKTRYIYSSVSELGSCTRSKQLSCNRPRVYPHA